MLDEIATATPPPAPTPLLYPPAPIAAAGATAHSVAIILRTKDRPLLLPRALASICAQTHRDWRLYLVNDGGEPAGVEAALAPFAAALAGRIEVIHRHAPPHGIWHAAQAALDRAREDLVTIHDDDDSWEPGFLAAVTGFLSKPAHAGHVAVTTGCTLIEEAVRDGATEEIWRTRWPHGRATVDLRRAMVDLQLPPISLAFRRAAIADVGGFETRLRYLGDWEFLLRLLLVGEIGHVDVPLANYHLRVRDTGGPYGNTVVDQEAARAEQLVLLHNAMLRAGLQDRPEMLGAMRALLAAIAEIDPTARLAGVSDDITAARGAAEASARAAAAEAAAQHADLASRLERIEAGIAELRQVAAWNRSLLRPLRWAWHRALLLRRAVARARGRLPPPAPGPVSPAMVRLMDLPIIGPRLLRRELVRRQTHRMGKAPELDPPRGFNDHVIARILRDRDPLLKTFNDKCAVRELARAALGDAALPPQLGVWEDPGEVPWASLPLPFVMKPSHASGLTYAVTDEAARQPATLTAMARDWLSRDYYDSSLEWGYRGIPRRLIIEPLLRGADGGTPSEAQLYAFGGRVALIRIRSGEKFGTTQTNNCFDPKGRPLPLSQNYPVGTFRLDPALAERLVAMATPLVAGQAHLRADFLLTDQGPLFLELTPYTAAGVTKWDPPEADAEYGRLWTEAAERLAQKPPPAPPHSRVRRLIDLPVIGPRLHRREMIRRYTGHHGAPPQLDPPKGFNAHIIHRILHDRDRRLKVLCDKVAIRPLIRERLGEALLPPLIGAWGNPAEVPWDDLPLPFMMKPSHASGLNYAVRTAEQMVPSTLTEMARSWLSRDYFDTSLEWGYRDVPRRLMIQPIFVGPDGLPPAEVQIYTFGGRASHIRYYFGGRNAGPRLDNWFERDGTRLPIRLSGSFGDHELDPGLAARLIEMAETMAAGLTHLRVDFMLIDTGPVLNELTAYAFAGALRFIPPEMHAEMDLALGKLWEEGARRLARQAAGAPR